MERSLPLKRLSCTSIGVDREQHILEHRGRPADQEDHNRCHVLQAGSKVVRSQRQAELSGRALPMIADVNTLTRHQVAAEHVHGTGCTTELPQSRFHIHILSSRRGRSLGHCRGMMHRLKCGSCKAGIHEANLRIPMEPSREVNGRWRNAVVPAPARGVDMSQSSVPGSNATAMLR